MAAMVCQRFARDDASACHALLCAPRRLSRSTCGNVVEQTVRRRGSRWPHGHGMQGVRGSNPLSSTPGQRPDPVSAVPGSPAPGSRSAATAVEQADPSPHRSATPAVLAGVVSWSDLPNVITRCWEAVRGVRSLCLRAGDGHVPMLCGPSTAQRLGQGWLGPVRLPAPSVLPVFPGQGPDRPARHGTAVLV
jgi:hypothetical protein